MTIAPSCRKLTREWTHQSGRLQPNVRVQKHQKCTSWNKSDFDLIWRLSDVTSKLKSTTTSTIYVYKYTQSTTSVYQFTLFGVPACSWRLCMTCSNLMNLDMSSNFKSLHVLNILKPHGTKPQETWIWGVVSEECARPHPNTKWVEQLAIVTGRFQSLLIISIGTCFFSLPEISLWLNVYPNQTNGNLQLFICWIYHYKQTIWWIWCETYRDLWVPYQAGPSESAWCKENTWVSYDECIKMPKSL